MSTCACCQDVQAVDDLVANHNSTQQVKVRIWHKSSIRLHQDDSDGLQMLTLPTLYTCLGHGVRQAENRPFCFSTICFFDNFYKINE